MAIEQRFPAMVCRNRGGAGRYPLLRTPGERWQDRTFQNGVFSAGQLASDRRLDVPVRGRRGLNPTNLRFSRGYNRTKRRVPQHLPPGPRRFGIHIRCQASGLRDPALGPKNPWRAARRQPAGTSRQCQPPASTFEGWFPRTRAWAEWKTSSPCGGREKQASCSTPVQLRRAAWSAACACSTATQPGCWYTQIFARRSGISRSDPAGKSP
jgi:hypothetical protein